MSKWLVTWHFMGDQARRAEIVECGAMLEAIMTIWNRMSEGTRARLISITTEYIK